MRHMLLFIAMIGACAGPPMPVEPATDGEVLVMVYPDDPGLDDVFVDGVSIYASPIEEISYESQVDTALAAMVVIDDAQADIDRARLVAEALRADIHAAHPDVDVNDAGISPPK